MTKSLFKRYTIYNDINENGLTIINDGTTAGIVIKDSNGNKQFYANSNGNLNLSGNIYASGGTIAGWSIETSQITKVVDIGNGNLRRVAMCSDKNSPAFYVTESTASDSIFKVNWDGSMYATSGTIGGWTISKNSLHSTSNNKTTGIQPPSSGVWAIAVGSSNSESWVDAPFRVDHSGNFYATNANISGTIKASGGNLDAWVIGNGGMYYNNSTSGCGLVGDNRHANIAIYAGANTQNIGTAPFRVYHDGTLYASNANITGTINASAGNVGKWKIFSEFMQATNSSGEASQLSASGVWTNQKGDSEDASWHEIVCTCMGGSDKQLKHNIIDFNSSHDNFFDALVPKEFQYNNKQYLGSIQNAHLGLFIKMF